MERTLNNIGTAIATGNQIKIVRRSMNKADAQLLMHELDTTHNRSEKVAHVKKLAQDMAEGKWKDNYAVLMISESGVLLDGHHRLTALSLTIDEDYRVPFTIMYDVPDTIDGEKTLTNMDLNSNRKPFEVVKILHRDLANAKEVVDLARQLDQFALLSLYDKFNGSVVDNLTVQELVERYRPLNTLDEMIDRAKILSDRSGEKKGKSVKNRRYSVKETALLVATVGTCESGNKFLEHLVGATVIQNSVLDSLGHVLDDTDPISRVTRQVESIKDDEDNAKPQRVFACVTQAYDFFLNGREAKQKFTDGTIAYPTDYDRYTVEHA